MSMKPQHTISKKNWWYSMEKILNKGLIIDSKYTPIPKMACNKYINKILSHGS